MDKYKTRFLQKKVKLILIPLALIISLSLTFSLNKSSFDNRNKAAFSLESVQSISLSVNASKNINPFSKNMLGQALVNWEHSWGKPYPNKVPGLSQAFKEAGVGVIRYAGGLWANSVGFKRVNQITPYTSWQYNGQTYSFHYGIDELESLNLFADDVGADVMIQVNIANYDPSMWADMVKYVNIEKGYNFKYWELGNELDYDTGKNVSPDLYASRVKGYVDAMKSVDPSIRIISGVPASAHDAPRQGYSDSVTEMSQYLTKTAPLVTAQGRKVDDLSFHWYQQCNTNTLSDITQWSFSGLAYNSWRNSYSRIWSQILPERIQNEIIGANTNMKMGITELNVDACNYDNVYNGNHINALWSSDVIGRLAYYGLDFSTQYSGYGTQGYSMVYPDNDTQPTKVFIRPSYYSYYMYNKYFGDQIVESSSPNNQNITIYASKDTNDVGKLKLRITNFSPDSYTTTVNLSGFSSSTGNIYILKSNNPTDSSTSSNVETSSTNINGVKLVGSSIASSANAIVPITISTSGSSFTYTFPAYTSSAVILNSSSTTTPNPTNTPVLTSSPTVGPTVISSNKSNGDFNNDGKVDILDLSILATYWGSSNSIADTDSDGIVGILDLSRLATNWGKVF